MNYFALALSFLQIGMFSIGGGYAAMPLIQSQVVTLHGWLSMQEFTDLITIAEMTPGPIAVNSATFVGLRVGGLPGALVATVSCILPSCFIVSLLSYLYRKYRNMSVMKGILGKLRPAVVALIASAGVSILLLVLFHGEAMGLATLDIVGLALFAAAFFALRRWKANPILVMALCGCAALALKLAGIN